MFKNYICTA